jgi:hypothetical protein
MTVVNSTLSRLAKKQVLESRIEIVLFGYIARPGQKETVTSWHQHKARFGVAKGTQSGYDFAEEQHIVQVQNGADPVLPWVTSVMQNIILMKKLFAKSSA